MATKFEAVDGCRRKLVRDMIDRVDESARLMGRYIEEGADGRTDEIERWVIKQKVIAIHYLGNRKDELPSVFFFGPEPKGPGTWAATEEWLKSL